MPTGKFPQNCAIVCLKRSGRRFEILCHKNKLEEWHNGIEQDPNKVLVSNIIFSNFLRGLIITDEELLKAFELNDKEEVIKFILDKEVKSEIKMNRKKEEQAESSTFLKEFAEDIAQITINTKTMKQFQPSEIENAIIQSNFDLNSHRQEGSLRHHKVERRKLERQVIDLLKQQIPIDYKQFKIQYFLHHVGATEKFKKMERYFQKLINVEWTSNGDCYLTIIINDMDYSEIGELIMDYKRSSHSCINKIWY